MVTQRLEESLINEKKLTSQRRKELAKVNIGLFMFSKGKRLSLTFWSMFCGSCINHLQGLGNVPTISKTANRNSRLVSKFFTLF